MLSQRRVGVVLGYANIIVKNLVSLIYTPMLLSFVGQADYGVYQSCSSFVFSLTLLSFGFSQAYIRFYTQRAASGSEESIRKLNGVYLVLYAFISIIALILGIVFAANAGMVFSGGFTLEQIATAEIVISIQACSISVTLFNSVFDAFIVAHEQFRFQQTRQLATTLVTPFLSYTLLLFGAGVIGVALVQLTVNLILLGLNAMFSIGRLGMRFDVRAFDLDLFRAIAVFSAWLFANQVCELVNQNVPNVLLGALAGAVSVAIFAVSVQIRSVFYSLSTTMSGVFTPLINRIVAETDDNVELTRLMARVGRYQAILYLWVLGGFALLGRFFISEWAGEEFEGAYRLILAMVTPLFIPLVQNTGIEIQRAKNRHKARSICYLVMAALNLSITIALAPSMGYWAPAIGYIMYVILGPGIFMNWYYHVHIGLDMSYFWRRILPVVGAASIVISGCTVVAHFIPVTSWAGFVLRGAVYTAIYLVFILRLVLTKGERTAIILKFRRL